MKKLFLAAIFVALCSSGLLTAQNAQAYRTDFDLVQTISRCAANTLGPEYGGDIEITTDKTSYTRGETILVEAILSPNDYPSDMGNTPRVMSFRISAADGTFLTNNTVSAPPSTSNTVRYAVTIPSNAPVGDYTVRYGVTVGPAGRCNEAWASNAASYTRLFSVTAAPATCTPPVPANASTACPVADFNSCRVRGYNNCVLNNPNPTAPQCNYEATCISPIIRPTGSIFCSVGSGPESQSCTCSAAVGSSCSVNLRWSVNNAPNAVVKVSPTAAGTLNGTQSPQTVTWIQPGRTYTFSLYENSTSATPMSSATVNGTSQPFCGNGVREGAETCDEGGLNGTCGRCNSSCNGTMAACQQPPGSSCNMPTAFFTCGGYWYDNTCYSGTPTTAAACPTTPISTHPVIIPAANGCPQYNSCAPTPPPTGPVIPPGPGVPPNPNPTPGASLNLVYAADPNSGRARITRFEYSATGTRSPGDVIRYTFSYGDGQTYSTANNSGSEVTTSHIYQAAGTYTAAVTAQAFDGTGNVLGGPEARSEIIIVTDVAPPGSCPNPSPNFGQPCTVANSCGQSANGVYLCSGGCSAVPPPNTCSSRSATLKVCPSHSVINVGATKQLKAYYASPGYSVTCNNPVLIPNAVLDVTNSSRVVWSSANDSIARVNFLGTVTGRARGLATITARTDGQGWVGGSASGSATVQVGNGAPPPIIINTNGICGHATLEGPFAIPPTLRLCNYTEREPTVVDNGLGKWVWTCTGNIPAFCSVDIAESLSLTPRQNRVQPGSPAMLDWRVSNVRASSCSIWDTTNNTRLVSLSNGTSGSGTFSTPAILSRTEFTLLCTNKGGEEVTASAVVSVLPLYQEL